jgi:FKBP-type peptidyl-prolyl cis-trans isomerase 2
MIPNAKLEKMSTMQLNDLVANIESIKKQKLLNELKIGSKVYVVQKTKKTPGVITKIMQSKCLVDLSGKIYRVSMSMLEVDA